MAKTLEDTFQNEIILNIIKAQNECGYKPDHFLNLIGKHGAANTVRQQLRRQHVSDAFDLLAEAGKLEYSVEAVVVKGKYAELFTDDEVNFCYDQLCAANYF